MTNKMLLDDLTLSRQTKRILEHAGIFTVRQLMNLNPYELSSIDGVGEKRFYEILHSLEKECKMNIFSYLDSRTRSRYNKWVKLNT